MTLSSSSHSKEGRGDTNSGGVSNKRSHIPLSPTGHFRKATSSRPPPPSVPHLAVDKYEEWMDGLDVNKPIPRLYPLQRSDTLRQNTVSSRRRVEEGHQQQQQTPLVPHSASSTIDGVGGKTSSSLSHQHSVSLLNSTSQIINSSSSTARFIVKGENSRPFFSSVDDGVGGGGEGEGSPSPRRPTRGDSTSSTSPLRKSTVASFADGVGGGGPSPSPPTLRRQASIRLTAAASGTLMSPLLTGNTTIIEKRSLKHLIKNNKDIRHYLLYLLSIGSSDPRDDLSPVDLNPETKGHITLLFAALDRDGDGMIFYEDLLIAVPILGLEYFSEVQYRRLLIDGHVIPSGGGSGLGGGGGGGSVRGGQRDGGVSSRREPSLVRFSGDAPNDATITSAPTAAKSIKSPNNSPRNNNPTTATTTAAVAWANNPNSIMSHSSTSNTNNNNQAFLSVGITIRSLFKLLFPRYSQMRIVTILRDMEHPTEKKKTARQLLSLDHIAEIQHLFNFFISQEKERNRLTELMMEQSAAAVAASTSLRKDGGESSQLLQSQSSFRPTSFASFPTIDEKGPVLHQQPSMKRRQSLMSSSSPLQRKGSMFSMNASGATPSAPPLSRFKAAVGKLSSRGTLINSTHGGINNASSAIPTISIAEIVAPVIDSNQTSIQPPAPSSTPLSASTTIKGGKAASFNQQQTLVELLKDKAVEHYEQFDMDGDGRLTLDQYIESMKHNYPPFKATELHRATLFDLTISSIPKQQQQHQSTTTSTSATNDTAPKTTSRTAAKSPRLEVAAGMRGAVSSVFKLDKGAVWVDSVVEDGLNLVETNHAKIVRQYSPRNVVVPFDQLSSPPTIRQTSSSQTDRLNSQPNASMSPRRRSPAPIQPVHHHAPSPPSFRGNSKGPRGGTTEGDALRPQTFLQPSSLLPIELPPSYSDEVENDKHHPKIASKDSLTSTPTTATQYLSPSPPRGGAIELRPIAPYQTLSPPKYGSKMLQSVKAASGKRYEKHTLSVEQVLQEPRTFGGGRVADLMSKWGGSGGGDESANDLTM